MYRFIVTTAGLAYCCGTFHLFLLGKQPVIAGMFLCILIIGYPALTALSSVCYVVGNAKIVSKADRLVSGDKGDKGDKG